MNENLLYGLAFVLAGIVIIALRVIGWKRGRKSDWFVNFGAIIVALLFAGFGVMLIALSMRV